MLTPATILPRWRLAVAGLMLTLATAPLGALEVRNYAAANHDRFASGWGTDTPVTNTDPAFILDGYDLSGIGWSMGYGTKGGTGATLITDRHFITAVHLSPNSSYPIRFVNRDGEIVEIAIESYSSVSGTDIRIGKLARAVTAEDKLRVFPVVDLGAQANYLALGMFVSGYDLTTGPRYGTSTIDSFTTGTVGSLASCIYPTSGSADDGYLEGGDSGSAGMMLIEGKLGVMGINYAVGGSGPIYNILSFAPDYLTEIDAILATDGKALTRLSLGDAPEVIPEDTSVTVFTGNSASLNVMAWGNGTLSYQWYAGTSGVTTTPVGTDSNSYVTPGLSAAANYWVAVTDANGTTNSATIAVSVQDPDSITPAAITDLDSSAVEAYSVTLNWTAPGDDANTGTATSYDIRYSTSSISNDIDFDNATSATGEPAPSVAGSSESFTVTGLSAETTYYFAIKTTDEQANTSALSNVYSTTTTVAPAGWTAYHNIDAASSNAANVTSGNSTTTTLVNYDTGNSLATTLDFTFGTTMSAKTSPEASAATDAYTTFNGIATPNTTQAWSNTTATNTITFANLPAGGTYTLTLYMNRGSSFGETIFTLADASGFTGEASAGVDDLADANDATYKHNSNNTATGYIVKWSGIQPTADGGTSFSVDLTRDNDGNDSWGYMPSLYKLEYGGDGTPIGPALTLDTPSAVITSGNSTTLSVSANGSGNVSYQWYEGTIEGTSTAVGTDSNTFTTPVLSATTSYWVAVTDDNGTTNSDTITVTVTLASDGRTIAHYGSSTLFGYFADYEPAVAPHDQGNYVFGDDDDDVKQWMQGYSYHVRELLDDQGWVVRNRGIPGWNTSQARYGLEEHLYTGTGPNTAEFDYVFIGLTLGNEGLAPDTDEYWVHDSFRYGINYLNTQARQNGITPLLGLVYTKDVYGADEYAAVKRMNRYLNSLDVPSMNFLGAVDDGTGHYTPGFGHEPEEPDAVHPNDDGHLEFFYAYVPSVYHALEAGKDVPTRVTEPGFVRIAAGSVNKPLSYAPEQGLYAHPVHSFALRFLVRTTSDGVVACIPAEDETNGEAVVYPVLEINGGTLRYTSQASGGQSIDSGLVANDGQWHEVLLSHYYASQRTLLFVDGALAGTVSERLEPRRFTLGGPDVSGLSAPASADYQDLMIWRSALNADEAADLYAGEMLKGSLEIYAPLRDNAFTDGSAVANTAQSLSQLYVSGNVCTAINPSADLPASFAAVDNATSVDLSWTDNSGGAAGFILERRALPAASDAHDVILDENDAVFTGTWTPGSGSGSYNDDYQEVLSVTGSPTATVTYTPDLNGHPGTYDLYIYRPDNASMQNFAMTLNDGSSGSVTVHQTYRLIHGLVARSGQWLYLGSYDLQDGANITYSNLHTEAGDQVRADAFRFIKQQSPGAWTPVATLGGGSTSHTDSSVNTTTPYEYQIRTSGSGLVGQAAARATVRSGSATPDNGEPVISAFTADSTISAGQTVALDVTANGPNLAYQWYEGFSGDETTVIAGATSNSYTTPALFQGTNYWVKVSNEFGYAQSHTISVAIASGPSISAQPVSQVILPGGTATLGVTASGTGSVTYQWHEGTSGDDAAPVSGATSSTYTTPALADSAVYWVQITDDNGTTNSDSALVTVNAADLTAPAAISNLASVAQTADSIFLNWTATGDDATIGTATTYDLRYSTSPMANAADFAGATPVIGEPAPAASGGDEIFEVTGLNPETAYYFAIVARDEAGNPSPLSNVVLASTNAVAADTHLLFNFGSTVTGNWNNLEHGVTLTQFPQTFTSLIYDDGTAATGASLDIDCTLAYASTESNDFPANNYATQSSGNPDAVTWLTDEASNSGIRAKTGGHTITCQLSGLESGIYTIEAYIANDTANYLYDDITALAGLVGHTVATDTPVSSANMDLDATYQTVVLQWPAIIVTGSDAIEISVIAAGSEWTLLNALRITRVGGSSASSPTTSYAFDGALGDYFTADAAYTSDPGGTGSLTQANDRLEYAVSSGSSTEYWTEWTATTLPKDTDWSAQGVFNIDALAPGDHEHVSLGMMLANSVNDSPLRDCDYAELYLQRYPYSLSPSLINRTSLEAVAEDNGSPLGSASEDDIPVQPIRLRMNYEAATQTLRLARSLDDGNSWVSVLASDLSTWDSGGNFRLLVGGNTGVFAVSAGTVWVDDISVTEQSGAATPTQVAITQEPLSLSIPFGDSTTLTVTVSGDDPSFQWYAGTSGDTGSPIPGATSASYTTPNLSAMTSYWVRVTGTNTVDSATATVTVQGASGPVIQQEPTSTNLYVGYAATLSIDVTATGQVAYQWYQGASGDTSTPIPGATNASHATGPITGAVQFWVRVTDDNGSTDSATASLALLSEPNPGQPDPTFDFGSNNDKGPNGDVYDAIVQSDGKPVIVGIFDAISHNAGSTSVGHIARLNTDGSIDSSFNAGTGADDDIRAIAQLPDGTLLIVGYFTSYNGASRPGIARLNTDGSLNTAYDPGTGLGGGHGETITLQDDGQVLIGGDFDAYNGNSANNLLRLHADLSHDSGFTAAVPVNGSNSVKAIGVQSDGKIVYSENFNYSGTLYRLHADGSADTSFSSPDENGTIDDIAVLANDSIIYSGDFDTVNDTARHGIARLNANGTLDTTFVPTDTEPNWYVGLHVQTDGRIIATGRRSSPVDGKITKVARYEADGTLDTTFDTGGIASQNVRFFVPAPDGRFGYIGGFFESFWGTYPFDIDHFARIYAPEFTPSYHEASGTAGLTGEDAHPDAIPFSDGVPNIIKHALGQALDAPANPALMPQAVMNTALQSLDFTFWRERADITYVIESSESLLSDSWTTEATDPGNSGESVTVNLSTTGKTRLFVRLRVEP